jgi:arginyl-tRNA synthetase
MTDFESIILNSTIEAIKSLYATEINPELVQLQETRTEFEGDYTLVVFPFLKISKKNPELTANEIGDFLVQNCEVLDKFNVIKGFLNLSIKQAYWVKFIKSLAETEIFGYKKANSSGQKMMIEYSSPNTNKPLHLGHVRNNLLGYSLSKILQANGHEVIKVNLVNDRGIHICKSMLAWDKWGEGITPEKAGKKGDHLVGDFYVKFDIEYKKQIKELVDQGISKEEAEKKAPLIIEAQEMLQKWEAHDESVTSLWKMMNGWVYEGFSETYKKMGVDFDRIYYESETYLLGKAIVQKGLEKGVLYQRPDSSVWIDLTKDGLDEKLLLRSDGTSVYMTQDLGTAAQRFEEYNMQELIYVVGNEQNYHFQVLSLVMEKLGYSWAKNLKHMSYGMVELPSGKMKSREGTVVDADDLVDEMVNTARDMSKELGKLDEYSPEQTEQIVRMIGLAALKYFILKVDPKKNMLFDPKESIDFNGNTGPFVQYSNARIHSILRKAADQNIKISDFQDNIALPSEKDKSLIRMIYKFPAVVDDAGKNLSPAVIANYAYELSKEFNQFYHDCPILKEENSEVRNLRLILSEQTGKIIKKSMNLLGIDVPERM